MHPFPRCVVFVSLAGLLLIASGASLAATVEYNLVVRQQRVDLTGAPARGMTINGTIPGPTLRFTEGDHARIHVHNGMDEATSIHWHGLLVPPGMDGVPYLSFPPIGPGESFTYEFPIRQSGTYWYHSHSGLQEQSGLYGAIVIAPRRESPPRTRDHVVLLSDWTDEDPHTVHRALKRGGGWYALEKGSSQSIVGAARLGMLGDYFRRELQRMPPMDIADVAYDRFLANGRTESALPAEPRESVRLRVINGSATTYFHVEFAGGPLTVLAADGQEVQPLRTQRLLIAVAETYDVLIEAPASGAHEFRATAHDGSGSASVWIGSGDRHPAPDVPRPNLYQAMGGLSLRQLLSFTPAGAMGMPDRDVDAGRFDAPGIAAGASHDMPGMHHGPAASQTAIAQTEETGSAAAGHDAAHAPLPAGRAESGLQAGAPHGGHPATTPSPARRNGRRYGGDFRFLQADVASSGNLAADGDRSRPWPPYAELRALKPTTFPADAPVRELRLTLDGDMERYVWLLNNRTLAESDAIRIRQGEVVRLILINRTMMHHPMHLHGHFFRVISGDREHAPLKHTVDVAPMSTTVIEFLADEFGDWFFHCHLLYHMKAGMARVVHYEGYLPDPQTAATRPALHRESWYFLGEATLLHNRAEGALSIADTRHIFSVHWEAGWGRVDHTEWEAIFSYSRYVNGFLQLFAGADLSAEGRDLTDARGILGLRYLLPLGLEAHGWIDSDRGARLSLSKSLALTPRLALRGEARYDTRERWEGRAGLSFTISRDLSLVGQWHSDFGFGAGIQIRF